MVFSYEVQSSDFDQDGARVSADSLSLNGGTVTDTETGNAATLSFPALDDASRHKVLRMPVAVQSGTRVVSSPKSGVSYATAARLFRTRLYCAAMNVIHILCDTLRRDHCGPYHQGRPLNEVDSPEQPGWVVPTPNLDRLAARGTVFERAYAGSTPCMPARRDVFTGRYEFPERGWGPLEEGDLDLPSLLSPPHTTPITSYGPDDVVSYFISDHKNMWCAGSGNYHFGFSGFEFIRGQQEDPWATTSDPFYCPPPDLPSKLERYWRNKHRFGGREQDMPVARTFSTAAEWLRRNAGHRGFYLQIDEFDPHEPWDRPRRSCASSTRAATTPTPGPATRPTPGGATTWTKTSCSASRRATPARWCWPTAGWARCSTRWTNWTCGVTRW